ncbi:hypothetical protein C7212DRAFT_349056 [Tuber magnatum]|uniref:Uncharacterized protein n=1 Tax=Tuber magnatum TaxID=42249 RepID=A0A317SFS2_9PEZI|nr:hypothetical protein C7212DRAFT_349056 [Tuber magnatum]
MQTPGPLMALLTPPESTDPSALCDNRFSATSATISSSSSPPSPSPCSPTSIRRSGRRSAKVPVYYGPTKRRRYKANTPAKRQKLWGTDPPETSEENSLPPPSKPDQSTPELSATPYSESSFHQSPAPTAQITFDSEPSSLPHDTGIPRFTPAQIRSFVRFNAKRISWRSKRFPSPTLPTAAEKMSVSRHHLRVLARAAASHYDSLPRRYGDPERCFQHLYKTFLPTAEFEKWQRESGGVLGERDTHVVLMKVFEITFLARFHRGKAEKKIWGLLGFEEEEEAEEEVVEQGEDQEEANCN